MGSSELSGAGGKGFRTSDAGSGRFPASSGFPGDSGGSGIFPSAFFAVAALILFAGFHLYQTMDAAQRRLDLQADMIAARLASQPAEAVADLVAEVETLIEGADLQVVHVDGSVLGSTAPASADTAAPAPSGLSHLLATRTVSGPIGSLAISMPRLTALSSFWWHLAVAAGLCSLAIAYAGWRARHHHRQQPASEVEALIGTTPFGIALWDEEGRLRAANRTFRRKLAIRTSDTAPGTSYKQVRKLMVEQGRMETVSDDENGRRTEYVLDHGTCLELDEYPLETGGFITLVSDCTEQRDIETRLAGVHEEHRQMAARLHREIARAEEASRAKSAFLAHLSHEIRTPLNHIIGFSDLICHQSYGPIGDKRYASYVDHIRQSGELLLASFSEILEFAELESGEKMLRRDDVVVNELLIEGCKRHSSAAAESGVALEIGQSSDLTIKGDAHCLGRMLTNIVENAVRYTPSGGRVSLAAWEADDGIVLEVSDTGAGISSDRLRSLGQAFMLGDDVFRRDREGAGLGIAISRTIAELSGGSLIIDSTPGLGTTVAIALPQDAARQAAKEQAA